MPTSYSLAVCMVICTQIYLSNPLQMNGHHGQSTILNEELQEIFKTFLAPNLSKLLVSILDSIVRD